MSIPSDLAMEERCMQGKGGVGEQDRLHKRRERGRAERLREGTSLPELHQNVEQTSAGCPDTIHLSVAMQGYLRRGSCDHHA